MPFRSSRQRRFIYSQASQGVPWAKKFIADSGDPLPSRRASVKRKRRRR